MPSNSLWLAHMVNYGVFDRSLGCQHQILVRTSSGKVEECVVSELKGLGNDKYGMARQHLVEISRESEEAGDRVQWEMEWFKSRGQGWAEVNNYPCDDYASGRTPSFLFGKVSRASRSCILVLNSLTQTLSSAIVDASTTLELNFHLKHSSYDLLHPTHACPIVLR
jgi:hypothetical protein